MCLSRRAPQHLFDKVAIQIGLLERKEQHQKVDAVDQRRPQDHIGRRRQDDVESLTDDDPDGPKEILPQTSDVEMVKSALLTLQTMHQGNPRVYDGIAMAAKKLRARAVCGCT